MPLNVHRPRYLMKLTALMALPAAATAGVLAHYTVAPDSPFFLEQLSGERTSITGSFSRIDSPAGVALHLDGHSTLVAPHPLSRLTDTDSPWSVSCWLTLDALPWNEAPVLDQQTAGGSLFFGIDAYGHLVARHRIRGRDSGHIVSQGRLAPRTWASVTLSYHDGTLSFAVNGNSFPAAAGSPVGNEAAGASLLIGHVRIPQLPYPSNAIHPQLPITYTLEGAIADLTVRDHVATRAELRRLTAGINPALMQPAPAPALPRWAGGPGSFGAFYTTLHYDPTWDAARRVGPDADVVVRFPQAAIQLVFWQGASYIPAWVTENGRWYSDEFVEIYGKPRCPDGEDCEPMSDKQVRYSHVDILESTPARAVIRWRYALSEVENQKLADAPTPADWGAWADEYWTVYPDAVAVRRQVLWTDHPDREGSEFQESIVIIPAGETPEDNINLEALTLANLAGESRSYTWPRAAAAGGLAKPRGPDHFTEPDSPLIQWVNLRSSWKPFEVAGAAPARFEGINWEPSASSFEWWNHWPVAQIRSSGRPALAADRPSHSSLSHIYWPIDHEDAQTLSRILLTGLTTEQAGALAPRARSWLSPPPARITGPGTAHYDTAQRAYVIEGVSNSGTTGIEIAAGPEHPLVNPAFVVPHWNGVAHVSVEGAPRDQQIKLGYVERLDGRTLIAYVPLSAQQPVKIILGPAP
jgi:Concanavalin A-like lectin/glucanases superfamily